jgi:cytochrome c553
VRHAAAWLAGVALVLGVPGTGYAVGLLDEAAPRAMENRFVAFTPASGDPRVAEIVAARGGSASRFMRFTPASTSDNGSRSVTVAVRVDQQAARAISARTATDAGSEDRVAVTGPRIAPTRYNLGLARGYQSFARPAPAPAAAAAQISDADMPDLAAFAPSVGVREKPSRFAARVQLEEGANGAGATPQLVRRSGEDTADQSLDVAGSYRLTRNLDVTAGVRYSQERDRLAPLPDIEEQDSRAIYIGTQFRF